MDYNKLSRIVDSKPYKGDFIKGKTRGGMQVEGRLVEETEDGYRVTTPDHHTIYTITKESAENVTLNERESGKKSRRIELITSELEEIDEQLQDIYNDPELEEWYMLHPEAKDDGSLPPEHEERISKLEKRRKILEERLTSIGDSKISDSEQALEEFWMKVDDFLDSDEDDRIIQVSESLSPEEIEKVKSQYQENVSENEFTLNIVDLGDCSYKVSVTYNG